jgi:hypothetical protein
MQREDQRHDRQVSDIMVERVVLKEFGWGPPTYMELVAHRRFLLFFGCVIFCLGKVGPSQVVFISLLILFSL